LEQIAAEHRVPGRVGPEPPRADPSDRQAGADRDVDAARIVALDDDPVGTRGAHRGEVIAIERVEGVLVLDLLQAHEPTFVP